jgi:lipopolysaccharide transport system permease protein
MDLTATEAINTLESSGASPNIQPTETQNQAHQLALPEAPLVVIQPSRSWVKLGLHDLWVYRELLLFLIWRDVKVRYKQTVLGATWVIMQPLLMTIVFTVFLGKLARVPSGNIPYPLLVYSGLLPWTFFSSALTSSSNSLVGSSNLITKVYFPRMIIPIAAVGARLVDFAIAFAILAGLMLYYGVGLSRQIVMLPIFLILITALSLGVGMWASAVNVKYRDVGVAIPVLVQLWMFASPVVYPLDLVPENWRTLYALNPMAGIIGGFRASLLGGKLHWTAFAVSTGATIVILIYAAYAFRRMEKFFADLV